MDMTYFEPDELWDLRALFLQGGWIREIKREMGPIGRYSLPEVLEEMQLPLTQRKEIRKRRISYLAWKKRLQENYHLTPEDYYKARNIQKGNCFLCERNENSFKEYQRFNIFLDPKTKQIKYLLCPTCQIIISMAPKGTKTKSFISKLTKILSLKQE